MSTVAAQGRTPRFSIVSAVYNVGRYLGEFIDSIEAQTFPLDQVEIIMVNDGSTDNSLEILEAWQKRRPELITIVNKPNGGLSSARNAAFEHLHGEWITFTDPDDILDANFLQEVDSFLRKRPTTVLVATNRIVFSDTTRVKSRHPLHVHFVPGINRFRNLDYDTGHFHGHAASSFFRHDLLQKQQLRFDERLRATFEDGHFCNIYLLGVPEPLVGYLSTALYNYRRRDDGTSQLDRSWANPERFTKVLEFGLLDMLRAGVKRSGRAPTWLQGMVLYELYWYFRTNDRWAAPTAAHGETLVRFHELFDQVCELLDETGIDSYYATRYQPAWRDLLLHGRKDEPWHTDYAVVDKLDREQELMRVTYRFTGELPEEMFGVYGARVEPVHKKIRDVRFFDRTMLHERIVWLPFGTLRVVVGGRDLDVRTAEPDRVNHRLNGVRIQQALDRTPRPKTSTPRRKAKLKNRLIVRLAKSPAAKRRFADSWVLIDRIFNADDSAEHLFRYLRKNRPQVNAWFVIEPGTIDHKRLRREWGRRVVAHGSLRWKLLMLNCQHLISSHIDDVIVRPPELKKLTEPRWRVTFLQHGITKDDLSTWLNRKNIEIFVTSTPAEFQSVAGDHTAYRYTSKEAKLTGLPRFDRILEEGNRFPPDSRDLILIAPTWRQWLSSADPGGAGRHRVDPEVFRSSEFATQWTEFLNSPELKELADRLGLTVAVLLHPNFQGNATLETLPHVRQLHFDGQNIQELFARARVLVSDYSSMFFNAAYIERPIVYFQFDRDRVLSGWHLGRRGYFDYERDGFGPVTLTVDDAVAATVKAVVNGPQPEPMYLERIETTFPTRDGRCCERVADAIAQSTKPVGAAQLPLSIKQRVELRARGVARRVLGRSPRAKQAVAKWRAGKARSRL